jgi:hypothetical protein
MTVSELIAHMADTLPPAPETALVSFESSLGCRLPEDYREFLIESNGGCIGGSLWFFGPTPSGDSADAGVHHVGGFRQESYFSLLSAHNCYQGSELRIPRELLWVMDDPFGNAICIGLTGVHRGRMFFWDHENEPDPDEWDGDVETAENVTLLAGSFTEFVCGLKPSDADE